jgi:Lon protease-like protein
MKDDKVYPERAGLMVLPGVSLFPHSLLPLYIFEERYRRMLDEALAGARMFGIAHAGEEGEVAAIASLGVVRACVSNADGTSNLILQGVARVRICGLTMKPFPKAQIELLNDRGGDCDSLPGLRKDIFEACRQVRAAGMETPKGFDQYLAQIEAHGAFVDAVAAAFVTDPIERRGMLEDCDVPRRANRLLRCLLRQLVTPPGGASFGSEGAGGGEEG